MMTLKILITVLGMCGVKDPDQSIWVRNGDHVEIFERNEGPMGVPGSLEYMDCNKLLKEHEERLKKRRENGNNS